MIEQANSEEATGHGFLTLAVTRFIAGIISSLFNIIMGPFWYA